MSRQNGKERVYRFIEDLTDIGSRVLARDGGIQQEMARELAREIALNLCSLCARTVLYIPAGIHIPLIERDAEIWRKYGEASATARPYSADRVAELAAEHELTAAQIYNIVRKAKQREKEQRQQTSSASAASR